MITQPRTHYAVADFIPKQILQHRLTKHERGRYVTIGMRNNDGGETCSRGKHFEGERTIQPTLSEGRYVCVHAYICRSQRIVIQADRSG